MSLVFPDVALAIYPIEQLEQYADAGDSQQFSASAKTVNWLCHPVAELLRTIDLALELGLTHLAMQLSHEGGRLFPDHAEMQPVARLLAPPVVRRVPASHPPGSFAAFRA